MWAEDVRDRANEAAKESIHPNARVVIEGGNHAEDKLDQIVGIWLLAPDAAAPDGWVTNDPVTGIMLPAPGPDGDAARKFLAEFNEQITSAQGWPIDQPGPPPAGGDAYNKVWGRA